MRQRLPPIGLLLILIVAWEAGTRWMHIPAWMAPAPHEVWTELRNDWRGWLLDTGVTLLESVLGFCLGSGFGCVVGVAFAHSRPLERIFYPYTIALKTLPLVAIAPILAIWFPNGLLSKVIMGAVVTFFPCIVNTVMGLRSPSHEMLDLMGSLSASPSQVFWKLRLPAALPSIFSAFKISATLAVVGALVAEMAGAQAGLGYRLIQAEERTDMTTMVTAVLLASLGGVLFFGFISLAERRLLFWRRPEEQG